MIQKIIEINGSPAVIIPDKFLKSANLKIGDEVEVIVDTEKKVIIIKPKGEN